MSARVSAGVIAVGPESGEEIREAAFAVGSELQGVRIGAGSIVVGSDIHEWPSGSEKLGSRPDGETLDWVNAQSSGDGPDHMQGVTTDAENWYFTTTRRIIKIPFDRDLRENLFERERFALREGEVLRTASGIRYREIQRELFDDGLVHNGDLDCFGGVLYVPMEREGGDWRVAVAAYDAATLEFVASFELEEDDRASACAVHPRTGLLYCAVRRHGEHARRILVLEREIDLAAGSLELAPVGELTLRTEWPPFVSAPQVQNFATYAFQGMAFSRAGHLYLAKDEGEDRGVHAFDVDVLEGIRGPVFFPL